MTKILVVSYSQTGQLDDVVENFSAPLKAYFSEARNTAEAGGKIDFLQIKPQTRFPFPWPFFKFFSIFPESVHMVPIPLDDATFSDIEDETDYDLIILAYTVWFLSPSLPVSAFLQSPQAKLLFEGKPVITLIGCRGMWLMAQEKVKKSLKKLNANLVDNVVLTDECGSFFSFLSTPLWMFTGKKKSLSFVPAAGIGEGQIKSTSRFGDVLVEKIKSKADLNQTHFANMGAVSINDKLILSEKLGHRSFIIWGKLLMKAGSPDSISRKLVLVLYVLFLVSIILIVVPVTAFIKVVMKFFFREKVEQEKTYFAMPSGE